VSEAVRSEPAPQGEESAEGSRRRRGRDRPRRRDAEAGEAPPPYEPSDAEPASFAAPAPFAEPASSVAPPSFAAPAAPEPEPEVEATARALAPPPHEPMPRAAAFVLPTDELRSVAEGAGLEWVGSDAQKIRAVQEAMASEPAPVRVLRERKPAPVVDEGPLVLVETVKDLSQMKLPFEPGRTPPPQA